MTNINKVINRYARNKLERCVLEAYLTQIGFSPMIVDVYLQMADRRKAKRHNEQAQINPAEERRAGPQATDTSVL